MVYKSRKKFPHFLNKYKVLRISLTVSNQSAEMGVVSAAPTGTFGKDYGEPQQNSPFLHQRLAKCSNITWFVSHAQKVELSITGSVGHSNIICSVKTNGSCDTEGTSFNKVESKTGIQILVVTDLVHDWLTSVSHVTATDWHSLHMSFQFLSSGFVCLFVCRSIHILRTLHYFLKYEPFSGAHKGHLLLTSIFWNECWIQHQGERMTEHYFLSKSYRD